MKKFHLDVADKNGIHLPYFDNTWGQVEDKLIEMDESVATRIGDGQKMFEEMFGARIVFKPRRSIRGQEDRYLIEFNSEEDRAMFVLRWS